jgi:hypothetical protein
VGYAEHFRHVAVERIRGCQNIVVLAQERSVSGTTLRWRDDLDPEKPEVEKTARRKSRVSTLPMEVNRFKRVFAEKTLTTPSFPGSKLWGPASTGGV